jgi:purine-binding chemotaxis protein CheW
LDENARIEKSPFSKMSPSIQLVVFTLENQSFALKLTSVHRVVRAFEVTPLPNAPAIILGVVNIHGELVAVVDLRLRFRLPARAISPDDQFILVNMPHRTTARRLVLVVDGVTGVVDVPEASIVGGEGVISDLEYVQGIAKLAGNLILIHDLERCLSLHEEQVLMAALAKMDH